MTTPRNRNVNPRQKTVFQDLAWTGPQPVKTAQKRSFTLVWFETEDAALAFEHFVQMRGDSYTDGWAQGFPCGREAGFDEEGLFAVSTDDRGAR